MAVGLVTIHHEGAGAPTTAANCQRFSEGGYCYGIGNDGWVRFRAPKDNWATYGFNGQDLTICLSGNRMDYPVSDGDLDRIHGAFMDCYGRGEVTSVPQVRAHRNSPGSSTACPGDRTMDRWAEVEASCRSSAPPKPPEPEPPGDDEMQVQSSTAVNADGRPELFSLDKNGVITHRWRNAKGGSWSDWQPLGDGPYDSVSAYANPDGRLEVIAHKATGGYAHCWQTAPNGGWSTWNEL